MGIFVRWSLLGLLVLSTACAGPRLPAPPRVSASPVAVEGFEFRRDTFAVPNEIRARHPEGADVYANYCFVLARALRQFFQFARFDPAAPRLDHDGYVERVRAVVARAPWEPALPRQARVVIPGYASLREFSAAEEAAVKAGLGGRFWSLVHWTNWRVVLPVTGRHQREVARRVVAELDGGRLVQLLVTNWPVPELNHTVVAFGYRPGPEGLALSVWEAVRDAVASARRRAGLRADGPLPLDAPATPERIWRACHAPG